LPEDALREAIVNAIAHRDYRSTANIQIYIFQDRVKIVNPGGLAGGIKLKDLGKKSIPRNSLLFGIMHRMERSLMLEMAVIPQKHNKEDKFSGFDS